MDCFSTKFMLTKFIILLRISMEIFSWNSEVRAHEIDVQGIVNNAYYLTYFDHARTLHLREMGINWAQLSKEGLNLVLAETTIKFLSSLRAFDAFRVESQVSRDGKLKLLFNQTIFNMKDQIVCKGFSTIACVDSQRNKPIPIEKIGCLQWALALRTWY